jgi:glycolate oxidase
LGGPRIKDVAGLSLSKLFVGSEGILGVVTEATLRLLPTPPPASTVVAVFPTVKAASEAVLDITGRLRPSMLELMDGVSVNAVEDMLRMGLDREAGALLLARSDAPHPAASAEAELIARLCRERGAETFASDDPEEGEALAGARRAALPALEKLGDLLLEDVGVPLPQFPALVAGIEGIAAEHGVTIATVAHAGDGNTHPVIVHRAADPESAARAAAAFGAIIELAISLGGTITGEHGVGRLKQPWLAAQLGPDTVALTRRIKEALDPAGILNPGAVLD